MVMPLADRHARVSTVVLLDGRVKKAQHVITGERVALKIIDKSKVRWTCA